MEKIPAILSLNESTNHFDALRRAPTSYPTEHADFINFLENHDLTISTEGIDRYLTELGTRTRRDREGREVGYSASWFNQRVKAVKETVRFALIYTDLISGQKYAVEQYLQTLRTRKPKAGISKAERVPNDGEVDALVEYADLRLALMIRFLAESGCRISEMLSAEVSKSRRGTRITRVEVSGKGGRTRDLRLRTRLFDDIIEEFEGARWLFEHDGRQYSRISVTNRIKALAERTIGKPVSAHMLRHYRGTKLSVELGISKAADALGHTDIRTTKAFYDHTRITDEEFERTLES